MKTVRFTEVVKKSGAPEAYTLWTAPKEDAHFQKAVRENRVLSVHQETVGTKADYGEVGEHHDGPTQLLIFPKSLRTFAGRRVVGVKYDLLEESGEPEPAPQAAPAKPKAKARTPKPKRPKAAPKKPAPAKEEPPPPAAKKEPDAKELMRGIKRALRLLDQGRQLPAYRVLEELLEEA